MAAAMSMGTTVRPMDIVGAARVDPTHNRQPSTIHESRKSSIRSTRKNVLQALQVGVKSTKGIAHGEKVYSDKPAAIKKGECTSIPHLVSQINNYL
jgi:hypothetical protein